MEWGPRNMAQCGSNIVQLHKIFIKLGVFGIQPFTFPENPYLKGNSKNRHT